MKGQGTSKVQNLISPPYEDFSGPYLIKIHIRYTEFSPDAWATNLDQKDPNALKNRAIKTLEKLNQVFNPYKIYFIWKKNDCTPSYAIEKIVSSSGVTVVNIPKSNDAIDIFDEGNRLGGTAAGVEGGVPSNYFEVWDSDNGVPAAHLNVLIHEMGHVLGLFHTHEDRICNENTATSNCGSPLLGKPICNCCGDFICDTPPSNKIDIKCTTTDHPIDNNYMSYPDKYFDYCRTLFTSEQVRRLWAHLSYQQYNKVVVNGQKPLKILQDVLAQEIITTGTHKIIATTPTAPLGNIIIQADASLTVNADIKMLPNAIIRVEKKGKLIVNKTITASCEGKMWQGVIVEGNPLESQDISALRQGYIVLNRGSRLEFAKKAVMLHNESELNPTVKKGSGGILRASGANFIDNEIDVEFGAYKYGNARNQCRFFSCNFGTTDNYKKYSTKAPVHVKIKEVIQVPFSLCNFLDNRTNVSALSQRATGILVEDATFSVIYSTFEKMYYGIDAYRMGTTLNSYVISKNDFKKCVVGAKLKDGNTFSVYKNNFYFSDNLANVNADHIGVQIEGNTSSFFFAENNFIGTNSSSTFYGTTSENIGSSANKIQKNKYTDINVGNLAIGTNADADDGLLYTCNTHIANGESNYKIESGANIRRIQALSGNKPVANLFSNVGQHTIQNDGSKIEYHYYKNNPAESPSYGNGYIGDVKLVEELSVTSCEVTVPCNPCAELEQQSSRFASSKKTKDSLSVIYPQDSIIKREIVEKQWEMNAAAAFVLQSYAQDTMPFQNDTIIAWYKKLASFDADLQLTRYYFFNYQFDKFEQIWSLIPNKYELNTKESIDYYAAKELYLLLQPYLENGQQVDNLSQNLLIILKKYAIKCNYAGEIARALLRKNDIIVEPICINQTEHKQQANPDYLIAINEIRVFPNPANNQINIKMPSNENGCSVNLRDFSGRLCWAGYIEKRLTDFQFSTADLNNGIYTIEIKSNANHSTFHKVIIIH
jgi:hypothetical protein